MSDTKRIGVMMDLDKPYKHHLAVYGGIREFARKNPRWKLVVDDWADFSLPHTRRGTIPYDGIIGRINVLAAERARRLDLPIVNLWLSSPAQGLPGVFPDFAKSGALVVDHLLSRGFQNLGAITKTSDIGSHRQAEAMQAAMTKAGTGTWIGSLSVEPPENRDEWQSLVTRLNRWMNTLKPPIGLLVRESALVRLLVELANDRGWLVPEQVAIVSSVNESYCDLIEPTITAVEMPYDQCGYEAAKLLDRLIDAKRQGTSPFADPKTVLLPPVGIVGRHSTDFFAVNDQLVQQCMRAIAASIAKPISPESLAEQMKVSRRTLDMRFMNALGVTAATEIMRLRIERVKRELVGGTDSIDAIGRRTGFASTRTLNDQFRRQVGMTPSEYRKQG